MAFTHIQYLKDEEPSVKDEAAIALNFKDYYFDLCFSAN